MTQYTPDRRPGVRVTVPASSANLGPGFDILAIALDLHNTYDVWETGQELRIELSGEGADRLPTDASNLFFFAMQAYFRHTGYQPSGLVIREHNMIPMARGLGSSAATIMGALVAARFVAGKTTADEELMDLALELEGHGDNVAAAMFGGFQLSVRVDGRRALNRRLTWPPRLGCAIFIPELLVSTESAREVLPTNYGIADVVHNLGRVALFVSALQEGRMEDLRIATEDRLHQPYRAELVPGLAQIIRAAEDAGAFGAFLSGAGPTILAVYDKGGSPRRVSAAMAAAGRSFGLEGRTMELDISPTGLEFRGLPNDPQGTPFTF